MSLLRIQGWILNSILFSTYCKQTEMVFERGEVLIQYFRRALIDILQQVQNGIDKDCISFWLENLIDLFLRSAHLYQDGGQVLAVLRAVLTEVENCRQSEDDPSYVTLHRSLMLKVKASARHACTTRLACRRSRICAY